MNIKDLKRLQKRLDKLAFEKQPPTLTMLIVKPEEAQPESWDQWTMVINVEPMNPAFNA